MREDEIAARLELDGPHGVVGELEALVEIHPLRESLWAVLMTALYRASRQADALQTYERVRVRLADDLGIDPGPELQELHNQILNQHASLDPVNRVRIPTDDRLGNLPAVAAAELIGRERQLEQVVRLLPEVRCVQ